MRYPYPVKNSTDFDPILLEHEIRVGGFNGIFQAVHIGGSALVVELSRELTASEVIALRAILTAHVPILFTWVENGVTFKEMVRCAEDVDRVTGQRIRRVIGGSDAVQEQLKVLRTCVWAHDVDLHPADYTQADMTLAAQIRQQMLAVQRVIEGIRTEGKNFKNSRGW